MATEFNYVARLDTTQIMAGVSEIRSQIGMAFGAPTGFVSPAGGLAGGGFAGMSQQSDFSAGLGSQFQQMFTGMRSSNNLFGGTFTNQSMAYTPHYGMVSAQSQLADEWQVQRFGMAAAQSMKPPGMSGAEYTIGMQANFADRQIDAKHAANMAAQSSFYAGVGGMAAGEAAGWAGAAVGAAAGGAIATRMFGAGAAGAGKMLGGLAGGWLAFDWAADKVGGMVEKHYAAIEQTQGITRELGEIAGGGRGLTRSQRTELGISARGAAGDLKMDVQEMGDILSLGRQSGMLPTSTDPGKSREQFREFARSIEEGAQVLHSSLAAATQVIRSATQHGQSAQEGIIRAAAAGGAENYLQMNAFGSMGAQVGRSMGFTGGQGSGIFMGALGAAGGAGMSGEEMRIMGGRYAAAQFIGTTQMGMATSSMGNAQLMAAMGGQNLSGMGMADMAGAAIAGLSSGGGDMMSNMGRFMVHQNEYRRGIGAGGIRTMARQQMQMGGELISEFMPDLSSNEAERMYAMSMGMNPDQAKLFVGGSHHSGGGMGGGLGARGQSRAIGAMQDMVLGANLADIPTGGGEPATFGWGYAKEGALLGGAVGGLPGAAIGGGIGLVAGNIEAIGDAFFGGGPGLFASATEKADYYSRKMATAYDSAVSTAKGRVGYLDVSEEATEDFLRSGNVGNARLDFDAAANLQTHGHGARAISMTSGVLQAMGLNPVTAGAGTIKVGGEYYSAREVQKMGQGKLFGRAASDSTRIKMRGAAAGAFYGRVSDAAVHDLDRFRSLYKSVSVGMSDEEKKKHDRDKLMGPTATAMTSALNSAKGILTGAKGHLIVDGNAFVKDKGEELLSSARGLVNQIQDDDLRKSLLAGSTTAGWMERGDVHSFLEAAAGEGLDSLMPAFMAGRAGGVAAAYATDASHTGEENFIRKAFGLGSYRKGDDSKLTEQFVHELTTNEGYLRAKEAYAKGHKKEGDTLLRSAQVDVLASNKDYRHLNAGDADLTRATMRPDAVSAAMAYNSVTAQAVATLRSSGQEKAADQLRSASVEMSKKILSTTTIGAEAANEAKASVRRRRRRQGPGTLQHAVGFGQQESAMSSINRALQHTERTLRAMEKRINKDGSSTPQGSSDGQTTT